MDAAVAVVIRFIEAVNAHDVKSLCDLMTEDHIQDVAHGLRNRRGNCANSKIGFGN
jgi:ketosteroid isomerase-like protein